MNDNWDDYVNDLVDEQLEALDRLLPEAGKMRKEHPQLRLGQALYNIAHDRFPSFVKNVPQEHDCFYLDEKIGDFLGDLKKQAVEQCR